MQSPLTVQVTGNQALLMRGAVQIGAFQLDHHLQIQGVTIKATATDDEAGMIIRLAGSHVAQYCVTPRPFRQIRSGVLAGNSPAIPAIPGLTTDDSYRLLDFNNITRQHAELSIQQITDMLLSAGININRQR